MEITSTSFLEPIPKIPTEIKRFLAGVGLAALLLAAVWLGRRTSWSAPLRVPAFRLKGVATAPVVLLEFSDFQCPSCAQALSFVKEFLDKHPADLRLMFRHHPLKKHRWAELAARAADCAGVQGRFWDYHDLLFARQKDWESSQDARSLFIEYARQLNLDAARFEREFNSGRWDQFLKDDLAEGDNRGVHSTPTFFINNRRVVGQSQLREFGERYLAWEAGR